MAGGAWAQPVLKALLQGLIAGKTQLHEYQFEKQFPVCGRKAFVLNGQRVSYDGSVNIMLTMELQG